MKDVLREYSMVVDKFVRHHARFLGAVMVTKMWWTWPLLVLLALQLPTRALAQDEVSSELLQLIVNLMNDPDKDMRAIGFEQVRSEAKGEAATKQFAAQLKELSPEAAVGLLSALADRGDQAAREEIIALLDASDNASIRVAGIRSLGALGGADDAARIVEIITSGPEAEQQAAKVSLVNLQGSGVAQAIVQQMKQAPAETQVELMKVLTTRRALDTIPALVATAKGKDPKTRAAAMAALGQLASEEHVPDMVQGVLKASKGAERAAAEKNVMFVCQRIGDLDQRAVALLAAMDDLNESDRAILLTTLGRVGGPQALEVVEAALNDRKQHSAGLRALCNWPDASVAPQLIEVVKTDKHRGHATTALRALIRIAPLPDGRSDQQKLDLLKQAMELCQRDDERILVLKRASAIRLPETLRFVLPYLDQPKFKEQACESIVELAHHRNLREPNEDEFHAALDQVIAVSKDAVVVDRANRYKRDETWVRPK